MSCESCKEALVVDGLEPDCFTPSDSPPYQGGEYKGGCRIPEPDAQGQRILDIRQKLITLHELVDAGTILRMYEATKEDIDLLAFVEDELKKLKPEEGQEEKQNG